MKYEVTAMEHTDDGDGHARQTWHRYSHRRLGAARRLAEKHGRRGVKRFGGTVVRDNWGQERSDARGGAAFPTLTAVPPSALSVQAVDRRNGA